MSSVFVLNFLDACLKNNLATRDACVLKSVAFHISNVLDSSVVFSSGPAVLSWGTPAFFAPLRSPLEQKLRPADASDPASGWGLSAASDEDITPEPTDRSPASDEDARMAAINSSFVLSRHLPSPHRILRGTPGIPPTYCRSAFTDIFS
jgi:hypothetical protein